MCPCPPFAMAHDATPLLEQYAAKGCPVDCGPEWSKEHILLMIERGPHRSALAKNAVKQLRHETAEKVKQGYARVVRWGDINNNIPPKLKISPVAMIPHKSKPYRCILDLSFALEHHGFKYPSVNEATTKLAPQQSMGQLGLVVWRIIHTMEEERHHGNPFWFAKLDIKDGFWRMAVMNEDAWNFAYVLPSLGKHTSLNNTELVIPNSLQMGWCESPPLFCAGSETARDIMVALSVRDLPPHKYEKQMLAKVSRDWANKPPGHVTTLFESYVDDFIAATNDGSKQHLIKLSRAMLHAIHSIFPPPEVTGHNGHDSIAYKKLVAGDGIWDTRKEILGWEFDGEEYTIQLPIKKCVDICALIKKCLKLPKVPLKLFRKLAGKLQHASLAIPSGKSLFTPFDMAMKAEPEHVDIDDTLRQCMLDWRFLVQCLSNKPTHLRQLVTKPPHFISYTDACKLGAGGVWCSGTHDIQPFLWQIEWPTEVQERLVTPNNPGGSITINDLELAGALLGLLALADNGFDLRFCHLATFCDNMTTVVWSYKLRNSKSIVAGYLLRLLGLVVHQLECSSLIPHHIAGEENLMADAISRAFKNGKFHMAANNLVPYFNDQFPLAQNESWRECGVRTEHISCVTACLLGKLPPMASLLRQMRRAKNIGNTGRPSQGQQASTHSSKASLPSNVTSSHRHLLQGSGRDASETEIRSRLLGSQTPSQPSQRPSSWLENPAPSTKQKTNTTSI